MPASPASPDCHARALPGEPTFTLLARDPDFAAVVLEWATRRMQRIARGEKPFSDTERVIEALNKADRGSDWRAANFGKWRTAPPGGTGAGETP